MRSIKILTLFYIVVVGCSIYWAWRVSLDTSNWIALIGIWVFGAVLMFELFNFMTAGKKEKLEHSKKLSDEGLKLWFKTDEDSRMFHLTYHGLALVEDTILGKVVYSGREFKAIQPSDPKFIKPRIWKDCKKHLMSNGYVHCWELWENSKSLSVKCNQNILRLLERIKSDVSEVLQEKSFPLQKWDGYVPEPSQYYVLDNIVSAVYQENREHSEGQPTAHLFPINELSAGFFRLEPVLAGSTQKTDVETLLRKLAPVRNDETLKQEILRIREQREHIKLEVEKFKEQLDSIIEGVDLDKLLKGKCDDCP